MVHIRGNKNIAIEALTGLPNNCNKKTAQKSNDVTEDMSENVSQKVKLIYQHQNKDPRLIDKFKTGKYKPGYFCGGSNKNLTL